MRGWPEHIYGASHTVCIKKEMHRDDVSANQTVKGQELPVHVRKHVKANLNMRRFVFNFSKVSLVLVVS